MNHKEIIDALISIAEATAGLEYDNGATQSIQDLIAALEATQTAAVAEAAAALSE